MNALIWLGRKARLDREYPRCDSIQNARYNSRLALIGASTPHDDHSHASQTCFAGVSAGYS